MTSQRDCGIAIAKARRGQRAYGMGVGVVLVDDVYPGFPGDVRNASGYPFPIQYEVAEDVDIARLVFGTDPERCLLGIRRASERLERLGCRAIVGECGYFSWFQREISSEREVPVFMSSLLQVPLAQQVIGPNRRVGILVARADRLRDRHLSAVGVTIGSNYVIRGAMDDGRCEEFDHLWIEGARATLPQATYAKAEEEFVRVGAEFRSETPDMGAMVLECTGFPPFARALQREIDIPVFSWGTMMDFAYSVVVHRDYYGHV